MSALDDEAFDDEPAAPAGRLALIGRAFEALQVRNYRLYFSGQLISRVGTWMQQVSLPWLVLALGGSPLQLGIVAALEFVPSMVLAPFGGVYVDRLDRRRALLATQAAASVQVVVLLILTLAGAIDIGLIMLLSFLLGLVNALDMPLRQSLAADLVPRPLLPNAIALNSMAFNSARIVGPAIGGVTIALGTSLFGSAVAGVSFNLAVNAVSYAAVLLSLWWMDPALIRRVARPAEHPPVLTSLREGLVFTFRSPIVLWSLVLLAGVATFGLNFRILLPLFVRDVLKLGADAFGLLYAVTAAGSLAGALALAFMVRRAAIPIMLGGGFLFGLGAVGLGLTTDMLLAVPLLFVTGLFSMLMINTVNATVQANVSDELRGRVMALYVTVFAGSSPIGGIFAGGIAQAWNAPAAFLAGGIISLLTVLFAAWRFRVAGRAGRLGVTNITQHAPRPGRVQESRG